MSDTGHSYYLVRTIYSVVNSSRLYGKQGDEVTVIVEKEQQIGVRGPDGQTFYVMRQDLTSYHDKAASGTTKSDIAETLPSEYVPPQLDSGQPRKSKRESVRKPTTGSLF